jgi:hypothetical protein
VAIGHRNAIHRLSGIIAVLFVISASTARPADTVPVVVATDTGEHLFRAEVADTPAARSQGLMFREELALDAAMLFLFDPPRRVSFWMKNTFISLDMLFIDARGRIVHIAERTEPRTLDPHGPEQPVRAVLEINGGLADRLGIRAGDVVRAPALTP